ncbi:hypothetical protein LC087_17255 [Bacillus carboniphilus]|uniref:Sin domain-containing protein n=1 Tax=Bacillus carboniphilus TaxID=86663 RepID=A0ABY9JSQ6_9BACI|nr:hypothetical protein [Bacillus carboniphilus]WLR42427.1 hypothetical protein LC087_17255 [Bacillus carboniphilus]
MNNEKEWLEVIQYGIRLGFTNGEIKAMLSELIKDKQACSIS